MTATDELRRLLYERGVEYEVRTETNTGIEHVIWHPNEFSQWDWNEELGSGWLSGWQEGITPAQAIEATLGSDECEQEEGGWTTEGDHARVWLTCGHSCMVGTVADLPKFCPECGKQVKVKR